MSEKRALTSFDARNVQGLYHRFDDLHGCVRMLACGSNLKIVAEDSPESIPLDHSARQMICDNILRPQMVDIRAKIRSYGFEPPSAIYVHFKEGE